MPRQKLPLELQEPAEKDLRTLEEEYIAYSVDMEGDANQASPFRNLAMAANLGEVKFVPVDGAVLNALKEKGPGPEGVTALALAASNGHTDMVNELIRKGADVNQSTTSSNITALYCAASAGHQVVVEALIGAGADVDKSSPDEGVTPLCVAACEGHEAVVRALIRAGADVNLAELHYGITPLWGAARSGKLGIVEALLEAGADVRPMSTRGTPLEVAISCRHMQVTEALLKTVGALTDEEHAQLLQGCMSMYRATKCPKAAEMKLKVLLKSRERLKKQPLADKTGDAEAQRRADEMMAALLAEEEAAKCSNKESFKTASKKAGGKRKGKSKNICKNKENRQGLHNQSSHAKLNCKLPREESSIDCASNETDDLPLQNGALASRQCEELSPENGRRTAKRMESEKVLIEVSPEEDTPDCIADKKCKVFADPKTGAGLDGDNLPGERSPRDNQHGGVLRQQSPGPRADSPGDALKAAEILLGGKLVVYTKDVLGTGCAGTRCVSGTYDGMPVAVKEILRSQSTEDMQQELEILRKITHRNVVRYYMHTEDDSFYYLVLEKCNCSLEDLAQGETRGLGDVQLGMLEGALGPSLAPSEESMQVARGILAGLTELHRVGVVHRDLKPSNVLLVREGAAGALVAKVADLGLGKALGYGQSSFMSARAGGTQCWQAPEQMCPPPGGVYNKRLDMFSLGCLLHFCFTGGCHPFGEAMPEQILNIMQQRPDLSQLYHLPLHHDLVGRMLAQDPKARPMADEVSRHPLWWSMKEQLRFMCRLSNFLKGRRFLAESLNRRTAEALPGPTQGRWKHHLTAEHLDALEGAPQGFEYDETVAGLLRAVRNTAEHRHEWGSDVQGVPGGCDEAVLSYFVERFPHLLLGVWRWACGNGQILEQAGLKEFLEPAFADP